MEGFHTLLAVESLRLRVDSGPRSAARTASGEEPNSRPVMHAMRASVVMPGSLRGAHGDVWGHTWAQGGTWGHEGGGEVVGEWGECDGREEGGTTDVGRGHRFGEGRGGERWGRVGLWLWGCGRGASCGRRVIEMEQVLGGITKGPTGM